jgi:tRNA pseudouridine55 synthase
VKGDPCGVLNLDKPEGMSSFAAVVAARRALGARKAGHAGTLDPFATGVLPICLGEATKLTQFLVDHEKVYLATLALGAETDTGDPTGAVVARGDASAVTRGAIEEALATLVGRISQKVPAYSAVRVGGERLYERARRGEAIELPTREVEVKALALVDFAPPRAVVEVTCGRGTYVRALATEIGRRLGCRAHLAALRRLRVGVFRIEASVTLEKVRAEGASLVGLRAALGAMPEIVLDDAAALRLRRTGSVEGGLAARVRPGLCAAVDSTQELLAVLRRTGDRLETVRVFGTPTCVPSRAAGEARDVDPGPRVT